MTLQEHILPNMVEKVNTARKGGPFVFQAASIYTIPYTILCNEYVLFMVFYLY